MKNTKEKLTSSFLLLLEEKNIDNISTRDVALKAKVSVSTIYKHFQNQESLIVEAFKKSAIELSNSVKFDFKSEDSITNTFVNIFNYSQKDISLFLILTTVENCDKVSIDTSTKIIMEYCSIFRELEKLEINFYVIKYFILLPFFKFCIDYKNGLEYIDIFTFINQLIRNIKR